MILICYHYVCSQIEDSSRIASLEDVSIRNFYWLMFFLPKRLHVLRLIQMPINSINYLRNESIHYFAGVKE